MLNADKYINIKKFSFKALGGEPGLVDRLLA